MNLSPEDKLLLCCARVQMEETIVKKIEQFLQHNLNWKYILETALQHGITPLLYHNLKNFGSMVPAEILAMLHKIYCANVAQNFKRYAELGAILKALEEEGIRTIVLKGAALAEIVYQNITLRTMGDVDLLVQGEKNQKRVGNIIHNLKVNGKLRSYYSFECEHEHHDLTADGIYPIDIQRFWDNAQTVKIAGVSTLMMAPEDLLLTCCISGCRHGFRKLQTLCDVYELTRFYGDTINWQQLIETAKQAYLDMPMFTLFSLARSLLGCKIPDDVIKELQPGGLRSKLIYQLLFRKPIPPINETTFLNIPKPLSRFALRYVVSHPLILVIQLFRIFIPQRAWMRQHYQIKQLMASRYSKSIETRRFKRYISKKILYLYYLIHPFMVGFIFIKAIISPISSAIKHLFSLTMAKKKS